MPASSFERLLAVSLLGLALVGCSADLTRLCAHCPNDGGRFLSNPDGGTPPSGGTIGDACKLNAECQVELARAYCVPEVRSDGGFSGNPGGHCYAECTDGGPCGTTGVCVNYTAGKYCHRTCERPWAGQDSCRSGYQCSGYWYRDGGRVLTGSGFCDSDCHSSGAGCTPPNECKPQGYCDLP